MNKKSFELGLRAQSAAEMIGGKINETDNGFVIETTMGGLAKYNIYRIRNLNTHCAVVAITRPMHETDAEVYISFATKREWEGTQDLLGREIKNILHEDMNDEIEWKVCSIEELLADPTPCWLTITEEEEEGDKLKGWYTIENHHHKVKFCDWYDFRDNTPLPF